LEYIIIINALLRVDFGKSHGKMCQVISVDRYITAASEAASSPASEGTNPMAKLSERSNGLRVLICSESVPPQVNGIARRIGMYADGLRNLGCDVGERNGVNNYTCLCYLL
jgi:hypothetical protein